MKTLSQFNYWIFYAAVFTLPMYMRLNNILLGAFIAIGMLNIIVHWRSTALREAIIKGWPVLSFFVLAIMASFHGWNPEGLKYLEKYWSLFFIPLVLLSDQSGFAARRRAIFLALLWGCVATLLLCYGNLVWEMISRAEPLDYIFRWRHVGHQFTAFADTHPTYLGLFTVISILFLVLDTGLKGIIKYLLLLILVAGLFQLASRMAILLFVMFLLFFLANKFMEFRWQIVVLLFGMLVFSGIFILYGSKYISNRLFSVETIMDDKRIGRWKVSYDIFREHPITGVGYANVKPLRKIKYVENDFPVAAASDYNAHNQFLEYLNSNGALGGFVYAIVLFYLLLTSMHRRETLFTFLFFAFIIANLTESMMVRIKGIEYFAIFATLFLCAKTQGKETFYEDLHNTGL